MGDATPVGLATFVSLGTSVTSNAFCVLVTGFSGDLDGVDVSGGIVNSAACVGWAAVNDPQPWATSNPSRIIGRATRWLYARFIEQQQMGRSRW